MTTWLKGLMFCLRYHEQEFIWISVGVLAHASRNQIKEAKLVKVKQCYVLKQEISVHAISTYGFYSRPDTIEIWFVTSMIAKQNKQMIDLVVHW